jgi:hypothetical protein
MKRLEKSHSEKLHDLYSPTNIIRMINSGSIGGACSVHGKDEKCKQSFGERPGREDTIWKN